MFNSDQPRASPIRRKQTDEIGLETIQASREGSFKPFEKIQEPENEKYSPGDYYNYSIKKKSKFYHQNIIG